MKIGATGRYPLGKLNADDEGELAVAIGIENGRIVIHFGKEIGWLALDADGAFELARLLENKAGELGG